jgi:hypothetical protein
MMKYLPLLPILALSVSLSAQTTSTSGAANAANNANANISRAATQTNAAENTHAAAMASSQIEQASASAMEATNVSAELTKKLDTRHAKVGDEVLARTTRAATLTDGSKLPRGTKLIGKVTEVHPRSKAEKSSHIAFALDHAVLHDGREVPIHAVLTSVTAASPLVDTSEDVSMLPVAGAQGGGRASVGSGLLGGAGNAAGGVASGVTNTAGQIGGAARSGVGSLMNNVHASEGVVSNAGASGSVERVPVANLPGVTLSSSADMSNSGSLDASGKNIDLESGTKLMMNVSASQQ